MNTIWKLCKILTNTKINRKTTDKIISIYNLIYFSHALSFNIKENNLIVPDYHHNWINANRFRRPKHWASSRTIAISTDHIINTDHLWQLKNFAIGRPKHHRSSTRTTGKQQLQYRIWWLTLLLYVSIRISSLSAREDEYCDILDVSALLFIDDLIFHFNIVHTSLCRS